MERAFAKVNGEFSKCIYAPLRVLKGTDEFAGVLHDVSCAYRLLRRLDDLVRPERFRAVLSSGRVDTALRTRDVARMDGPAFHPVAADIEQLRRDRLHIAFRTGSGLMDQVLAHQVDLLLMLRHGYSSKQLAAVRLYDQLSDQKLVAGRMGVSQQAVSAMLRRTRWAAVRQMESCLDEALKAIDQGRSR